MNSGNLLLSQKYVNKSYIQQATQALSAHENKIQQLLQQGRCPENGWEDSTIELFLHQLSMMDSNNFLGNVGVGEREARIASNLVSKRHYRMGHGIGRSGDISEIQPKAAGSSLMNKLTNSMVLHMLQASGVPSTKSCLVVPLATGMSLMLCMSAFRQMRPNAKFILWSRIDQKACFKSMLTAGFEPVIIEGELAGDEIQTNLEAMEDKVKELQPQNVLCVMTTTSCFAPRAPDKLEEVAKLCKHYEIPHLVNNAYGVQASKCMHLIHQASLVGRVDAYVQSTDKNFMVPVGGAVIAGFSLEIINQIAKMYPGRGSSTPTMDMLITLLTLGTEGYKKLRKDRKETFEYLVSKLSHVAEQYGERVLHSSNNKISVAMTLSPLFEGESITGIGSMLFTRFISGTRTVPQNASQTIGGYNFKGWGAHYNSYPCSYLTVAAALGTTKDDVNVFIQKLEKVIKKFKIQESGFLEQHIIS